MLTIKRLFLKRFLLFAGLIVCVFTIETQIYKSFEHIWGPQTKNSEHPPDDLVITRNWNKTQGLTITAETGPKSRSMSSEKGTKEYAVDMPSCKIAKFDPWDPSLFPEHVSPREFPTRLPLSAFTLTIQQDNLIRMNQTVLKESYVDTVKCVYQYFHRLNDKELDFSEEIEFDFRSISFAINMTKPYLMITCYDANENVTYRCPHIAYIPKIGAGKKLSKSEHNVILIGIDSLSRATALRYMPQSIKVLKGLKALDMQGYTMVGENKFLNMLPILTRLQEEDIGPQKKEVPFDTYLATIFDKFSKKRYATQFIEDGAAENGFNHGGPGFLTPPADSYFRPFSIATRYLVTMKQKASQREATIFETHSALQHLMSFIQHHKSGGFLSVSFLSGLSLGAKEQLRTFDPILEKFFLTLHNQGYFKETFIFLLGDYGSCFRGIGTSRVGRKDSRLPALFILPPSKFLRQAPEYFSGLRVNSRRLTTPLDVHATLLHMLEPYYPPMDSAKSLSLFHNIPSIRNCRSAGIPLQFCPCEVDTIVNTSSGVIQRAAQQIVAAMNERLSPVAHKCQNLSLTEIEYIEKLPDQNRSGWYEINETEAANIMQHYRINFVTTPCFGQFAGIVTIYNENGAGLAAAEEAIRRGGKREEGMVFEIGHVVRYDVYEKESICIQEDHLGFEVRSYCCCKSL